MAENEKLASRNLVAVRVASRWPVIWVHAYRKKQEQRRNVLKRKKERKKKKVRGRVVSGASVFKVANLNK